MAFAVSTYLYLLYNEELFKLSEKIYDVYLPIVL